MNGDTDIGSDALGVDHGMAKDAQQRRKQRKQKAAKRDNLQSAGEALVTVEILDGGRCTVPEGVEHCHGTEIKHVDGVSECIIGDRCDAPHQKLQLTPIPVAVPVYASFDWLPVISNQLLV